MHQRTIQRSASIRGTGLHTGTTASLTFLPAPAGTGIRFRRTDLPGSPEIPAAAAFVSDTRRGTSLTKDGQSVHTVEHALSALAGLGIDNAWIELDGPEVPILDGSAAPFVSLLLEAGVSPLESPATVRHTGGSARVSKGKASLCILPHDGLRITCLSTDDRGFHTQELTLDITPEVYAREIAPARTFTFYEDIEPLLAAGKIKGGSLDCAIVIKDGVAQAVGGLRFADEFVRHKILDVIGDLALAGLPLSGHVIAIRPGHALNTDLARNLLAEAQPPKVEPSAQPPPALEIRKVLELLPHRYPFVMLDRIVSFEGEDALIARKCVTINEPFFTGHFPDNPVMPGVLQLEAMAQAAGILLLRKLGIRSSLAFFMSADKVKFRRAVVPGDVLEIRVRLTRVRGKIGIAEGECVVDGKVCSSAELMFTLVEQGGA